MEWLLGVSVVFNILLLIVIAVLVYAKLTSDNETSYAMGEWQKWERRFYEAQSKVLEEYNLFIAPTMGEFGSMIIKDKNTQK